MFSGKSRPLPKAPPDGLNNGGAVMTQKNQLETTQDTKNWNAAGNLMVASGTTQGVQHMAESQSVRNFLSDLFGELHSLFDKKTYQIAKRIKVRVNDN